MHREINKSRHIIVFIVSAIIFLLGILVGAQVEQFRVEKIENDFRDQIELSKEMQAEIDYMNFQLDNGMNTNDSCDAMVDSYLTIVEKLDDVVFALEGYESSALTNQDDYIALKERYFNIQTRYFVLAKKINSLCDNAFDIIVYFYGNDEFCPACADQGTYLDHVKQKYDEKVMIFSFDVQSATNVVDLLKSSNNVEDMDVPLLIINEDTRLNFSSDAVIEDNLKFL